jgi:hypothetical protein
MGRAVQRRWPTNAEATRKQTIDYTQIIDELLRAASDKLAAREHPAIVGLDIAEARLLVERIRRLMIEAKVGSD